MFKAADKMVRALCVQLKKQEKLQNLDVPLVQDMLVAIMKCPGMTETEKVSVARAVYSEGIAVDLPYELHQIYRVSPYADVWPFEVLGRRSEGVDDRVLAVS